MRLSKLHGLGNDFLVLLDDGSVGPLAAERVRALCSRHTGVGADGLIRSERLGGQAISFALANADGSLAEMSGNGARCLGLAAARGGWWPDRGRPLALRTPAGERHLDWQGGDLERAELRVGMGPVVGGPADGSRPGLAVLGATLWLADVGNPHEVALLDGPMPSRQELDEVLAGTGSDGPGVGIASASEDRNPAGAGGAGRPGDGNVEFVVRGPEVGAVTMVVRERGAGWTQACGTGSVAAAWAAHQQGWVGRLVTVHNPGGAVQVDLSGVEARLIGPAAFVAMVEVGLQAATGPSASSTGDGADAGCEVRHAQAASRRVEPTGSAAP